MITYEMRYKNTLKPDSQCLMSYYVYCNISGYVFFYPRFTNNYTLNDTNLSTCPKGCTDVSIENLSKHETLI